MKIVSFRQTFIEQTDKTYICISLAPVGAKNSKIEINHLNEGKVKPETLCPWETGKQLLSLPESELLSRLQADGLSEKAAKEFYLSLWKILIDARTRQRDSKLKAKAKRRDPAKLVDPNFSVAFYIDEGKQKSEEESND